MYGFHEFSEYQKFGPEAVKGLKLLDNKENLPWTVSCPLPSGARAPLTCNCATDLGWCGWNAWADRQSCLIRALSSLTEAFEQAWYGLDKIGAPKKGETIFVSGASGAVGQCVVPIYNALYFTNDACRMVIALSQQLGLKVIGSAGSDEKVGLLR